MRARFILPVLFLLCFPAAGMAQAVSGKIEKLWVDHDVYQDGEKGMRIHIKFSVNNMRGQTGECNAYFYLNSGTELRNSPNSGYAAQNGHIMTGGRYTPGYDNSSYGDYQLFMPNNKLNLGSGEHSLKLFVGIFDQYRNQFATSDWYHFSFKNNSPAPSPSPASAQVKSGAGGISTKTVYNANGSYTVTTVADCPNCFGTGSKYCIGCNGTGQKAIYGYPIYYISCPVCAGAGKTRCMVCSGVGQIGMSNTHWPNVNPNGGGQINSGGGSGGYIGGGAGNIGGGTGNIGGGSAASSTVCKGCRGSGSCGVCSGSRYLTCGGCGGSGIGSSGTCGGCGGAGKNTCRGCSGSGNCGVCYGSGKISY